MRLQDVVYFTSFFFFILNLLAECVPLLYTSGVGEEEEEEEEGRDASA